MEAEHKIDQIKEILSGNEPKELKRALEMLIRRLDAMEMRLEKKIDKKFEEQKEFIASTLGANAPRPNENEADKPNRIYS